MNSNRRILSSQLSHCTRVARVCSNLAVGGCVCSKQPSSHFKQNSRHLILFIIRVTSN